MKLSPSTVKNEYGDMLWEQMGDTWKPYYRQESMALKDEIRQKGPTTYIGSVLYLKMYHDEIKLHTEKVSDNALIYKLHTVISIGNW
jgi:hypothetical protein